MLSKLAAGSGSFLGAALLLIATAALLQGEERAKGPAPVVLTVYSDYV